GKASLFCLICSRDGVVTWIDELVKTGRATKDKNEKWRLDNWCSSSEALSV
ncbi:unnamed protein product, partial [Musa hybrid cultivar]